MEMWCRCESHWRWAESALSSIHISVRIWEFPSTIYRSAGRRLRRCVYGNRSSVGKSRRRSISRPFQVGCLYRTVRNDCCARKTPEGGRTWMVDSWGSRSRARSTSDFCTASPLRRRRSHSRWSCRRAIPCRCTGHGRSGTCSWDIIAVGRCTLRPRPLDNPALDCRLRKRRCTALMSSSGTPTLWRIKILSDDDADGEWNTHRQLTFDFPQLNSSDPSMQSATALQNFCRLTHAP